MTAELHTITDRETKTREQLRVDSSLRDKTDRADMQWILSDPRGRRFLRRLLEHSHVWRRSFTPGIDGARHTDFKEGERSVGVHVLEMIGSTDPKALREILVEHEIERATGHG